MAETSFEISWFIAILGIPIGLLFTSWRRYLTLPRADRDRLRPATIVLSLLSLTTAMWILFYALASMDEHSAMAKSILDHLSLGFVVLNILISAALLIASFLTTRPVRLHLLLASTWMLGIWLFASLVH
jgi:hypothetical protein